ncbi:DUF3499 domain-containing protein [Brachybacterium rhamnosum]|uniref:DUF3499 domain-containing protein n=1 Tax=Brachybacterium rhamnosum TaxID=173361 RepID=A0ABW4Q3G1_9MICO|nr:DUF3499 domain-containing protein [Brachybacterium sp. SGAir0954]
MRGVPARECSRTACSRPAVSTLTFVYADSTAVLGPLSRHSEPHTYDLCAEHASRTTAPRGWELLRVEGGHEVPDELVALADALRPPRPVDDVPGPAPRTDRAERAGRAGTAPSAPAADGGRHLRVVRSADD